MIISSQVVFIDHYTMHHANNRPFFLPSASSKKKSFSHTLDSCLNHVSVSRISSPTKGGASLSHWLGVSLFRAKLGATPIFNGSMQLQSACIITQMHSFTIDSFDSLSSYAYIPILWSTLRSFTTFSRPSFNAFR